MRLTSLYIGQYKNLRDFSLSFDGSSFLDVFVIKGILVRGSAGIVGLAGMCTRSLHNGNIHSYVYWFVGGLVLLWAAAGLL